MSLISALEDLSIYLKNVEFFHIMEGYDNTGNIQTHGPLSLLLQFLTVQKYYFNLTLYLSKCTHHSFILQHLKHYTLP